MPSDAPNSKEALELKRRRYLLASVSAFMAFATGLVLMCMFYAVAGVGFNIGVLLAATALPAFLFFYIIKYAGARKKISDNTESQ